MLNRPTAYIVTFVTKNFVFPDGHPFFIPLASMYIASAVRRAGIEPKLFHLLPDHMEYLISRMETEKPSWVGFSTLTGDMLAPAIKASQRARSLGIPVVWGGVHASTVPELCLKDVADHVVVGEAEETIMELGDIICRDGPRGAPMGIAGAMSLTPDGVIKGTKRAPVADLDSFPPAWDMIEPAQYIDQQYPGGAMPFLFSRGCPYRCRFCYNETMRAGKWRRHSDEYLAETIDRIRERASFSTVNFSDDFLFETVDKSSSWMEVLAKRGLKWIASFRSRALTPEFARMIEEMGCIEVRIGMESGHPDTLKSLRKALTVEDHYQAARSLASTRIRAMIGFVINWPKESRDSILETLKLTDDLARINPRLRFNLGYYIPMPGTPVYREALEEGFPEPASNEEWSRIFDHPYRYRGFSKREIEAMEVISGRLYRHYLKPWPLQRFMEPAMRWRWRNGYFRWFAIGAIRRWLKESMKGKV